MEDQRRKNIHVSLSITTFANETVRKILQTLLVLSIYIITDIIIDIHIDRTLFGRTRMLAV